MDNVIELLQNAFSYLNHEHAILHNNHIHADASVGIAYASLHAGPAVQNLKPHADALSH